MRCKLCLKERDLCNSHIIPEFMYKPLYDSLHRFHMISFEPDEKNKYLQKGVRERLLCFDCEQHISKYETYSRNVFTGDINVTKYKDREFVEINNIDYKQFKLFQMSILWRIGIASKRGFKKIRLGPHEEILRKMILSNEPGSSVEYGCIMVTLIEEDDGVKGLTILPELLRLSGHRVLRVLISGAVWIYKVSSHSSGFAYRNIFLKENGILTIYSRNAKEVKMLKGLAIELGKTGKLD